jgi:hypothetical protein
VPLYVPVLAVLVVNLHVACLPLPLLRVRCCCVSAAAAAAAAACLLLLLQPCVIFMDEIDAIGGRRFSEGTSADREIQRTLMELLSQLDGFDVVGKVCVCGGGVTNCWYMVFVFVGGGGGNAPLHRGGERERGRYQGLLWI